MCCLIEEGFEKIFKFLMVTQNYNFFSKVMYEPDEKQNKCQDRRARNQEKREKKEF